MPTPTNLLHSMALASRWLSEIAQLRSNHFPSDTQDNRGHRQVAWQGAIRGEYRAADRKWDFFCPVWHTGQAVASLAQSYELLQESRYLDAAKLGAEFIQINRIGDPAYDDFGLLLAYEDEPDKVNVSAVLETLWGLLELYRITGNSTYLDIAKDAVEWVNRKALLNGQNRGLIQDCYDPAQRRFLSAHYGHMGRPLADDSVFLTIAKMTGIEKYKFTFFEILERLLKDEFPAGNWLNYGPCNSRRGTFHPRHAYWWGLPFVDAYLDTGEDRYLQMAIRSGQWYVKAQRRDGGIFRGTYTDFTTDSFGHAVSGVACAVKFYARLWKVTHDKVWIEPAWKGLKFCRQMQMINPADPNLKGVIVEKVLPPDGTDKSLLYVRDLGTIFYIQAVYETFKTEMVDVLPEL